MKPITEKDYLRFAREGRVDLKKTRAVIQAAKLSKPSAPLDERSGVERIGDELARFTAALESMSEAHANNIARILGAVLSAIGKMENKPAEIKIPESRPRAYRAESIVRDAGGLIESAEFRTIN